MISLFHDEPVLVETRHPKKVLIAVDLEEYSEKVVAYALTLLRGLPCEFNLVYSLNNNEDRILGEERIADLLKKIKEEYKPKSHNTFKTYVFEVQPIYAIKTLLEEENFLVIVIGTSNNQQSNKLGSTARNIFLHTNKNIILVPPNTTIKTINQLSIIVDNSGNINFDLLNQMKNFLSYYAIFINLFLFVEDRNVLTEYEYELLKKYKDFFDENPSFPHLVTDDDIFSFLCKGIDGKNEDLIIVTWDTGNFIQNAYALINGEKYKSIFCNSYVPMYVSKEKIAIVNGRTQNMDLSK